MEGWRDGSGSSSLDACDLRAADFGMCLTGRDGQRAPTTMAPWLIWHFPCTTDICLVPLTFPLQHYGWGSFSVWNHLGYFLLYYRLYFAAFLFPQHYWPFQYSAVLQRDFLTIIHHNHGGVWKTGCCNTQTTHTQRIHHQSQLRAEGNCTAVLHEAPAWETAAWSWLWLGRAPCSRAVGICWSRCSDCMHFPSNVTDFQASPWGSLEVALCCHSPSCRCCQMNSQPSLT